MTTSTAPYRDRLGSASRPAQDPPGKVLADQVASALSGHADLLRTTVMSARTGHGDADAFATAGQTDVADDLAVAVTEHLVTTVAQDTTTLLDVLTRFTTMSARMSGTTAARALLESATTTTTRFATAWTTSSDAPGPDRLAHLDHLITLVHQHADTLG